ncbi:MAG: hypothetical protein J6W00_02840 [Lentisphaeria bacterium]|nr:hypothetical protein [Lentisphaeria bacterium]
MEENKKITNAAEETIDSIKKLIDAIGNDDELKEKLEETLVALTGRGPFQKRNKFQKLHRKKMRTMLIKTKMKMRMKLRKEMRRKIKSPHTLPIQIFPTFSMKMPLPVWS